MNVEIINGRAMNIKETRMKSTEIKKTGTPQERDQ